MSSMDSLSLRTAMFPVPTRVGPSIESEVMGKATAVCTDRDGAGLDGTEQKGMRVMRQV